MGVRLGMKRLKGVIKILDFGGIKHHDFRSQRAVNKMSHLDNVRMFRKVVKVCCTVV